MRKQILFIALLFLPLCAAWGQEEQYSSSSYDDENRYESSSSRRESKKSSSPVFTGFSGGMMIHAGYMFSDSPDKLFSNTGLGSEDYRKNLPKDGAAIGLGGALRIHLLDHIHLGAEGHVSTMPLMKTGSSIRTGWGGALCDYYFHVGKIRPMLGMTVGGGSMRRLYVPNNAAVVVPSGGDSTFYNASFTRTPFFLLDPYVGMEIGLSSHVALIIRIDYMLAFGRSTSDLVKGLAEDVKWSNFMTPSGPRLYVGLMFGKMKK
ncbi:MAG: hypothetical protein IKQ48_01075 [Paludibacteraceae bacterium]|nr:hypothetical protein [Paludibacteraceae bacterium]